MFDRDFGAICCSGEVVDCLESSDERRLEEVGEKVHVVWDDTVEADDCYWLYYSDQ